MERSSYHQPNTFSYPFSHCSGGENTGVQGDQTDENNKIQGQIKDDQGQQMVGMRKTIENGEDCGMLDSYSRFKGAVVQLLPIMKMRV